MRSVSEHPTPRSSTTSCWSASARARPATTATTASSPRTSPNSPTPATCAPSCRPSSAASGSTPRAGRPRAGAARGRRARHRARGQHAPGLDRRRQGAARPRRRLARLRARARPAPARSSPSGSARRATTSCCSARRRMPPPQADGGYRFTGTKIFTSLSPAWTRLGTMGLDTTTPGRAQDRLRLRRARRRRLRDPRGRLGHARHARHPEQHDRARRRPLPRRPHRAPARPRPQPRPAGLRHLRELRDPARRRLHRHRRRARSSSPSPPPTAAPASRTTAARYAHDPDIRWRIADAAIAQDALLPQLDALARDVDDARRPRRAVVPEAGRPEDPGHRDRPARGRPGASGSRAARTYFAGSELGRLYRDVLAGIFHPSDAESAHSTVANALLGPID